MSSDHLDVPTFIRDLETAARDNGWTTRHLSPTKGSSRPWFQRKAAEIENAPRFYLSTGVHGNEIAGPTAVLEMLRTPDFFRGIDATLFPILNPEGLSRNQRKTAEGVDLNRDYRIPVSAEARGHLAELAKLGRFEAAMFLHEDYEGEGLYLYELNEGGPQHLALPIVDAVRDIIPIDHRRQIDEFMARGGVVKEADILLTHGPADLRVFWPEALYLKLHHTNLCYTIETPSRHFPLVQRVAGHMAAVHRVLVALREMGRA